MSYMVNKILKHKPFKTALKTYTLLYVLYGKKIKK
jgi:hypothetical protein